MKNAVATKDLSDRDILEAMVKYAEGGPTPDVGLAHRFPVKVVMNKMHNLERRRWINSGVSLRTAWIERIDWLRERYPDLADRYDRVRTPVTSTWTVRTGNPLADVQSAIDRIMVNTGHGGPTQDEINAANAEIERLAAIVGPDAAIAAVEGAMQIIHGVSPL